MALDSVTRREFGWPKNPDVPERNTNRGMVAHYDGSNQGLANKDHSACVGYWTRTRVMHIRGNGWSDIGYAYGVCPHGYIFEGRGYGYEQAAQRHDAGRPLADGNTRWVSCTFMSGPSESPTPEQLEAWHRLRSWLMSAKGMASAVKGHRDFSSTDCPGSKVWKLVTDGTLTNTPKDLGETMALPMLSKGSKNYDVKTARADLFARGYVPESVVSDSALRGWLSNILFDEEFENMVIGFQRAKGLDPDGIIGPLTWAKLRRQ